jgi:hypothetical protein
MIKHPNISAEEITKGLGLLPSGPSFTAGTPRFAPNGAPRPGFHAHTMWSDGEIVRGNRRFFDELTKFIDRIEKASAFLRTVMESGGSAVLMVYLPGDINIGSVMTAGDLGRMSALGLDLSIEVFPNFK